MKRRALLGILCLFACLAIYACTKRSWQGFQGTPAHGLRSYTAELRRSEIGNGRELDISRLFVARDTLRYEMHDSGPFANMILLARLDSGQARLVNPVGNRCLEGHFTPQRWMDIAYLLKAFPKVAHPRIIAHKEEPLGTENLHGYKVSTIRRTGRESLFGETRDFTESFWLAEEFAIPLRHEDGTVRSELTNIREGALADSLFTPPAECRNVTSFTELLQ